MTTIYIIRHAEAEGNLYRRVQGHYDGKITPRGRKQIAALAERFRDIKIDAIYASDLSRTQETAGAILKYHALPLHIDPRLKEVCMGVWENETWGDVEIEYPEQLAKFSSDPDEWQVEGSERFEHVGDRMLEVTHELAKKHEGETIALVSHGMAIRALHCRVLGVPSRDVKVVPHGDNTCVSLYTYENEKLVPQFRNDNSHLTEGLSTFSRQSWWKKDSGRDKINLRFAPLNLQKDAEYYIKCYTDSWLCVYGDELGFDSDVYLREAKRHSEKDEACVARAISDGESVGLVELDLERAKADNACWISLFYLDEAHRGLDFGPQLLGYAANIATRKGFSRLRLSVSEDNEHAIGFYKHFGFAEIDTSLGIRGTLKIMEKVLS